MHTCVHDIPLERISATVRLSTPTSAYYVPGHDIVVVRILVMVQLSTHTSTY